MPLIKSTYHPSFLFKNAHINTVFKTLFYNESIPYTRKRIDTSDGDFLDLDFSIVGSNTLVITLHGLEGSSKSKYLISLVKHLNSLQIDCLAPNFRGCSGEDNTKIYSYNSGKTDDISEVVNYVISTSNYKNIIIVGYSMGGNIALKYLGETINIPSEVKGAIAISVPTDLEGSSRVLGNSNNAIYMNRFLKTLKVKSVQKQEKFNDLRLNIEEINKAKNFSDFDNAVTAPLFGFKNASDYWEKSSSKPFIPFIKLPTLIINALDDSFLSKSCHPIVEADQNNSVFLETPKYGGHVGFNTSLMKSDSLWSENRVSEFIKHIIY
jgi:predicted alpha/beta-fold hydrolase